MPNFRYRALTQSGELVSGVITAPDASEVARRIDYLRLVPIDSILEEHAQGFAFFKIFRRNAHFEDITHFTIDLALLITAGAKLDEALELLATDVEMGRMHSTVCALHSSILSGETFADSLTRHPDLFPTMYVALVSVGEASGTLGQMLHVIAKERSRAEEVRRKLADALRYPSFIVLAAVCVLIFFLMFVLPQFSAVLRDFGAEIDPIAQVFIAVSGFLTRHNDWIGLIAIVLLVGLFFLIRHPPARVLMITKVSKFPVMRTILAYHRAALFCRNLEVLIGGGVSLTATLRILTSIMAVENNSPTWTRVSEQVRQGAKLSDALGEKGTLPSMAVRMLRLGEETGQLAPLSGRVAEFYETKLQRTLDRILGLVGPLAIVGISILIGGLIVSVMTSLLSVSQLAG